MYIYEQSIRKLPMQCSFQPILAACPEAQLRVETDITQQPTGSSPAETRSEVSACHVSEPLCPRLSVPCSMHLLLLTR